MESTQQTQPQVEVAAHNIGGIDRTAVTFSPGVTILSGRNATNRTSFLQAIMAALGSEQASVKADADKGSVELSIGDETYTRTLTQQNGTVATSGDPYLDDAELIDLFSFLLESNEARRAVARGDDLRNLIMCPVDTKAIQEEIERLTAEKRRIDDELEELESLGQTLPTLEAKQNRLANEIEEKRTTLEAKEAELEAADADLGETRAEQSELESKLETLRETRSHLEDIRFKIETEEDSIEALQDELTELEREQADISDVSADTVSEYDRRLETLRERKQQLNSVVSELQTIIQFNEEMLGGTNPDIRAALQSETSGETSGSVTDQLVAETETVVCWTCGTNVEKQTIESTLDQLRTFRQEKLDERSDLNAEIGDLEAEKAELEAKRQKRDRIDQRRKQLETELDDRNARIDDLRDERASVTDDIETLEQEVEALEQDDYSQLLDLHREANQLEFELERLETDLEDVELERSNIEDKLSEKEKLEERRVEIRDELADLRTRIEQIEADAVEEFNEHMARVLDLLDYENLERIWIERTERNVREGRRKVTKSVFELHIIRSTESGATYEDTIDHLSESEREVTGLVFALAGYLVHEVYDHVPFILLDSLEAIDSNRIARLVDYFSDYAGYLVAALLPEDAAALDDEYERVTEI
ncbi:AAA domain-containing protein [Haladaptatus litoreus]|uniref:AAA domain-containing protein n=1 Tax=Haladaptatus litoreus TaxID=553468 RepID=A0A1N7CLX0_9EURY|nr:archaea-specific SMC-related protein [Haladaptatus litoreus]SIR64579.1 AAA domain-containing protein [Haladaptatus litoreus]